MNELRSLTSSGVMGGGIMVRSMMSGSAYSAPFCRVESLAPFVFCSTSY